MTIEARVTINMPGTSAGDLVLVDPDLPYIRMCLDCGALVPTGREFSVPSQQPRRAVRPPSAPAAPEPPKPARETRKRAAKKGAGTSPSA